MIFDNGYHQLYNDVNAEQMLDYITSWINRDSVKNKVLWNSAKVKGLKTDFLRQKNYITKFLLILIGLLIALIAFIKKFKKWFKVYKSL